MGLNQFLNSIKQIRDNPHASTINGINRHMQWQFRKAFNIFPFELYFSNSKIISKNKYCGVTSLINSQGLYDYNNMKLLLNLLKNELKAIFIDIGANIGSYTLLGSENKTTTVYSFEPHPKTYSLLKENISANSRDNVFLANVALGEKKDKIIFTNEQVSSINRQIENGEQNKNTISLDCIRFDQYAQDKRISPDYVKIDVEGYEYGVLKGFGDFISKVKMFFIETDMNPENKVISLLKKHGFSDPLFCNFDNKMFLKSNFGVRDDPVFVNNSYREFLTKLGFTFE